MTNVSSEETENIRIYIEKDLCDLEKYAVSYFSLNIFLENNPPLFFCTHSEWQDFYNRTGLVDADPCVKEIYARDLLMLPWVRLPDNSVMRSRRNFCGIKEGVSLYGELPYDNRLVLGLGFPKEDSFLSLVNSSEGLRDILHIREKWILTVESLLENRMH